MVLIHRDSAIALKCDLLFKGGRVVVLLADIVVGGELISAAICGNGQIRLAWQLSPCFRLLCGDKVGRARLPENSTRRRVCYEKVMQDKLWEIAVR